MTKSEHFIKSIVAAAEWVLVEQYGTGIKLGDAIRLTEENCRNVVIRCRDVTGIIETGLIIKKTIFNNKNPEKEGGWDIARFTNDWAGAAFLDSVDCEPPLGPQFFGGDRENALIIIEDLGETHHSLVETLLEGSAKDAERALMTYAARMLKPSAPDRVLETVQKRWPNADPLPLYPAFRPEPSATI